MQWERKNHLYKTEGSQRANSGKAKSNAHTITREIKKGATPLYIVPIGIFVMFLTTKTQMATGGMTTPIMATTPITIPRESKTPNRR